MADWWETSELVDPKDEWWTESPVVTTADPVAPEEADPSMARSVGRLAGEVGGRLGTFGAPLGSSEGERNIAQEMLSATQAAAPRMGEGIGNFMQIPHDAQKINVDTLPNRLILGDAVKHLPKIPNPFDVLGDLGQAVQNLTGLKKNPVDQARVWAGKQLSDFSSGMLESDPIRPGKDIREGKATTKRRARALSEAGAQVVMQVGMAAASGGSSLVATMPMAMQEAGSAYNETRTRLLSEGMPEKEAEQTAATVAYEQGVMISITEKLGLDVMLKGLPVAQRGRAAVALKNQLQKYVGKLTPKAKWALLAMEDRVAAALAEGSTEAIQEDLGSAINLFTGGDENAFDNIVERNLESFGIGAIVGGGASAVMAEAGERLKKLKEIRNAPGSELKKRASEVGITGSRKEVRDQLDSAIKEEEIQDEEVRQGPNEETGEVEQGDEGQASEVQAPEVQVADPEVQPTPESNVDQLVDDLVDGFDEDVEEVQKATQDAIASGLKAVQDTFGETWTPAEPQNDTEQEAADLAKRFGLTPVFFTSDRNDEYARRGGYAGDNVVFLKQGQGDAVWGVVGDEIAHGTKLDLEDFAQSGEVEWAKGDYLSRVPEEHRGALEANPELLDREAKAHLVRTFMEDESFRNKLQTSSPTLWQRIVESVLDLFSNVIPSKNRKMVLDKLRSQLASNEAQQVDAGKEVIQSTPPAGGTSQVQQQPDTKPAVVEPLATEQDVPETSATPNRREELEAKTRKDLAALAPKGKKSRNKKGLVDAILEAEQAETPTESPKTPITPPAAAQEPGIDVPSVSEPEKHRSGIPMSEVVKLTGLKPTAPALNNTGLPRDSDAAVDETVSDGTTTGNVAQIWRTASANEEDGVLHLTLDIDGKQQGFTGKEAEKFVVATEPPQAPVTPEPGKAASETETPDVAPDTARIQAEKEAREQAKQERKQRVAPEGYASLPEKTRTKFDAAWDGTDQQAMKELLDPANKSLRAEFERRTEQKLPRTITGTEKLVDKVYSERVTSQSEAANPSTRFEPTVEGMTVKGAEESGFIEQHSDGSWSADGLGAQGFTSASDAIIAYDKFRKSSEGKDRDDRLKAWESASVKGVRDGDTVELRFPDGTVETMTMRTYRQRIFDLEDAHGTVELIDKSDVPLEQPAVEAVAEVKTGEAGEPDIPAFTRTTEAESITRQDRQQRVKYTQDQIAAVERDIRETRKSRDGLRRNATRKRAAADQQIRKLQNQEREYRKSIEEDERLETVSTLEDALESPKSHDHYLAGMMGWHRANNRERDGDQFSAKLQARAKEVAKSKGFDDGDANQIALSAANTFTVFEDRSLDDIVDIHGTRVRESRVSQEIGKLFPRSVYGKDPDLTPEQRETFKAQYQKASLDDKGWLEKKKALDKEVEDLIATNRKDAKDAEQAKVKVAAKEKSKSEREMYSNARAKSRAKSREERIEKGIKSHKTKKDNVFIRDDEGRVVLSPSKRTSDDRKAESYPSVGMTVAPLVDEKGKPDGFAVVHTNTGFRAVSTDKKGDAVQLVKMMDVLGMDMSQFKTAESIPSEFTSRMKKVLKAWEALPDMSALSEADQAAFDPLVAETPTTVDADMVLNFNDLNALAPKTYKVQEGSKTVTKSNKSPMQFVKELATEVPEFAYDPVFTVQNGKLVYRDGYKIEFEPTVFNVHPSELTEGETVGINLEDLGIKRKTPQDVVGDVLEVAGFTKITRRNNKQGVSVVATKGVNKVTLRKGDEDNDWSVSGKGPAATDATAALKKIRWRQPGQVGDPNTDLDGDKPFSAESMTEMGFGTPEKMAAVVLATDARLPDMPEIIVGKRKSATDTGLKQDQKGKSGVKAFADFSQYEEYGRILIAAVQNPDVSSALHEIWHVVRRVRLSTPNRNITQEDIDLIDEWSGKKASGSWNKAAPGETLTPEEKFARGGERFDREGIAPTKELQSVFEKLSKWMRDIYQKIAGSPIDVNIGPVRHIYAKLSTPSDRLYQAADDFGDAAKRNMGPKSNSRAEEAAGKLVRKALEEGMDFDAVMKALERKGGVEKAAKMRPMLQKQWDMHVDRRSPPDGPPRPHPEVAYARMETTGTKHAKTDELRKIEGLPERAPTVPETFEEWEDRARREYPDSAARLRLVGLAETNPERVGKVENAAIGQHITDLTNRLASGEDVLSELLRTIKASDIVGTEAGRALVSRKVERNADFSLAELIRTHVNEVGVDPTAKDVAQYKEMEERLTELQEQLEEARKLADIDEEITKNAPKRGRKNKSVTKVAKKVIDSFKDKWKSFTQSGNKYDPVTDQPDRLAQAGRAQDEMLRAATEVIEAVGQDHPSFATFWETVKADIGEDAEPVFRDAWNQLKDSGVVGSDVDPGNKAELSKIARQIQQAYVESGMRDREQVIDAVHEAMKEFVPEITRRETIDALAKYGQFTQPSKDDIATIIRQMNAEVLKLAQIDDAEIALARANELREQGMSEEEIGNQLIEEDLLVKATGFLPDKPHDAARDLAKIYAELKKDIPASSEGREGMLQTALSAIERTLNNRIRDVQKEIADREPLVRTRRDQPTSEKTDRLKAELALLIEQRDALPEWQALNDEKRIRSAEKSAEKVLAALQAEADAGFPAKPPQGPGPSSEKLSALRTKIEGIRKQRDAAQREGKRVDALDKQIEELQKKIKLEQQGVDTAKKTKQEHLPLAEAEREAFRMQLQSELAALRAAKKPKMSKDERYRRAYETSLRKRIAKYEDMIARGDFDPAPKKEPRKLSQSELDLKMQLADIKHDFFEKVDEHRLANLSPVGKGIDAAQQTAHLSRAMMTSVDLSAVLRQGGLAAYSHPILAEKAAAEMMKSIAGADWRNLSPESGRKAELASMEQLKNDPVIQFGIENGLDITESEGKLKNQEEAFMGRWVRGGIGKKGTKLNKASKLALEPVAASARSYTTFINNMRGSLFKQMVENLGRNGQVTPEEAKLLASYVNVLTGRSDFKSLNKKMAAVNAWFFAPRYVASRFQFIGKGVNLLGQEAASLASPSMRASLEAKTSKRVRRALLAEYARTFTGAATFIGSAVAMGALLTDDDDEKPWVEFNPLSPDFLKIRIGETRLDPMAGLSQAIVLSSRMALGRSKSSVTGEIKKFGETQTGIQHRWDLGLRFLRTKAAPIPGAVITAASDMTNVVGQKETPLSLTSGLFIPLSVREISDAMTHRGIPKGTALSVLGILGMGMNTYGPVTSYLDADDAGKEEMLDKYVKYMDWDSELPAFSKYLTEEQIAKVQNRQEEKRGDLVYAASSTEPVRERFQSDESYEQAVARRENALAEFEEFRKEYAPTFEDALRFLQSSYGDSGLVVKGTNTAKPGYKERIPVLWQLYQNDN